MIIFFFSLRYFTEQLTKKMRVRIMFPTVFSTLLEGWYFAVDFEGWGHTNDKDFFSWGMSWYAPKLVSTHLVPHTHEHLNHFDGWSVGTERTIKDSFFSGCVAFHHLNALMTFVIDRGIVEICFSTYNFWEKSFQLLWSFTANFSNTAVVVFLGSIRQK